MKKIVLCIFAVIIAFSLNCYASAPPNSNSNQGAVSRGQPFLGWNKLDLRAKKVYNKNQASEDWVELTIKVHDTLTPRQIKSMNKSGFQYAAIMNRIITGKIKIVRIPELADLDFVEYVEAGAPLSPKKEK